MTDQRRYILRRIVLTLAVIVASCIAGVGVLLLQAPRTFRTHQDTVSYYLEQHRVNYRAVVLTQSWRDSINYTSYTTNVSVQLRDGRMVNGRLGCEFEQSSCFLELHELGIRGARVQELTQMQEWPGVAWLRSTIRQIWPV